MKLYVGMKEVVRELKIPRHRIIYALSSGKIPEPGRIQGRRVFTKDDIAVIRAYFQRKEVSNVAGL